MRQKQNLLLNLRSQQQQVHDLRHPRPADVGEAGGVVLFEANRVKNFHPSDWHREHEIVSVKTDLLKGAGRVPGGVANSVLSAIGADSFLQKIGQRSKFPRTSAGVLASIR